MTHEASIFTSIVFFILRLTFSIDILKWKYFFIAVLRNMLKKRVGKWEIYMFFFVFQVFTFSYACHPCILTILTQFSTGTYIFNCFLKMLNIPQKVKIEPYPPPLKRAVLEIEMSLSSDFFRSRSLTHVTNHWYQ